MGTGIAGNWAPRKRLAPALLILLAFAASLAWTSSAEAYIYYTDSGQSSILRANLDGSGVTTLVPGSATNRAFAVAVDANHIYWTNPTGVGRANLDGSAPNGNFIASDPGFPGISAGIAVDGANIYWARLGAKKIGRANLDGGNVQENFISTPHGVYDVDVSSDSVFWTSGAGEEVASTDDSDLFPDLDGGNSRGIATHAGSLYWAADEAVETAVPGGPVTSPFVPNSPNGNALDVEGSYVYWVQGGAPASIMRASSGDGSGAVAVVPNAIGNSAEFGMGLAVDSLGPTGPVTPPPTEPPDGKVKEKQITLPNFEKQFQVNFQCQSFYPCTVNGQVYCGGGPCSGPSPARSLLKQKKVGTIKGDVPAGETGKVRIKLKQSMARALKKGPVTLKLKGTITTEDGGSSKFSDKLKLKLKK